MIYSKPPFIIIYVDCLYVDLLYNGDMDNQNRIANLAEEKYLATVGIRKPAFDKMVEMLESAYRRTHRAGGRPPRLAVALGCYHGYRTMENTAFDYGVSKSRICGAVKWAEKTLI
jgi:hypothetical protein